MAKTNKEKIELPLLITIAQTLPLMGSDWKKTAENKIKLRQRWNTETQYETGQYTEKNIKTSEWLRGSILRQ